MPTSYWSTREELSQRYKDFCHHPAHLLIDPALIQVEQCARCWLQSDIIASSSSAKARAAGNVHVCLCPSMQPQAATVPETPLMPILT